MSFEKWYAAVSVGDEGGVRTKARAAGVLALSKAVTPELIEVLLKVILGGRFTPDASALSPVRQPFLTADVAFDMSGNEEELRVLCAATLAELMTTTMSSLTVLSILATAVSGGRTFATVVPLTALAQRELAIDAEQTRSRPALKAGLAEVPKFDFDKAKAKIDGQPDFPGVSAALPLLADSIRAALKVFAQRQADALGQVLQFVAVQDEELEMLWWLVGGRSEDYDCAFEKVPADAQPLVLSKELADRTATLPGPAAVKALLARAGLREAKKVTVVSAVNGLDAAWARRVVEGVTPSLVITPIHFAIQRQLETGAGAAWVAGWAAASGLEEKLALTPLDLGQQFYRERLLLTRE